MSSPVATMKGYMKEKNQTKIKIKVGSVVKAKVGELEKITREGISRSMRKEVVGCVQSVARKNNLPVKLKYVHKKEIGYSSLEFLSLKEEVDMDEAISHSPEK